MLAPLRDAVFTDFRRLAATMLAAALAIVACSVRDLDDQPADDAPEGGAIPSATMEPLEGGAPAAPAQPVALLPDLQLMPTREAYIEVEGDGRVLRFSTTVLNAGEGPLELAGEHREAEGIIIAMQNTLLSDGSYARREVGRFVYHPEHAHWHFEDFTLLEVWTADESGQPAELMLSTGKYTFCAVDEVPEFWNAAEPAYFTCGEGTQGISRGWSDTYGAEIPGQELALGALPDGEYVLKSAVDPANRLAETDDDNNVMTERVRITGAEISFIDG